MGPNPGSLVDSLAFLKPAVSGATVVLKKKKKVKEPSREPAVARHSLRFLK
jgi:hypothetical protein